MKLQQIYSKIVQKISKYAFRLFGMDSISRTKINGRDDLKEIGTTYGGWIVPVNLLNAKSICYCVGCGEDISFDLGLVDEFGCNVFAFDPTPRSIEHVKKVAGKNSMYHFYEVGLWDKEETLNFYAPKDPEHVSHSLVNLQKTEDCISVKVKRLAQIMEEIGHNKIDLIKMDIEGAEYKVIETIIKDNINIKVLCVEYDECYNPLDSRYKERIQKSVLSLLESGYYLVCAQGNGNYTFVKNNN